MSVSYISGIVQKGASRGKELGYPTANIALQEDVPHGIYISTIRIGTSSVWHPAITFVGDAKTFEESLVQAETYIFDFNEDIYDTRVTINLLEKIRENKKFDTVDALIKQIEHDVSQARTYFERKK